MEESENEGLVRGTIKRITFQNPVNGYVVLQVELTGRVDVLTVVGTFPKAGIGIQIVARGSYTSHPKFGRQLQAASIVEVTPSTSAGIEKYLASGVVHGIGPKTAERLVREFGEKTLELILSQPQKVASQTGIGQRKVALLHAALAEQHELQEILRFLLEHNVNQGLAQRIYERYGKRAIEILSHDPYLLARDLRGVGFATADSIAMNLGLDPNSPRRYKAGIYHALERAQDDGHCFLPLENLLSAACLLLGLASESAGDLMPQVAELVQEGFVERQDNACYLKHLSHAESFVANFIAARAQADASSSADNSSVSESIARTEKELGLQLSHEQRAAATAALHERLLIITGGPGCGKTTVIRALVNIFRSHGKRLFLAAPTGRAAQRMSQVCDHPASTIHRLLKYDPREKRFSYGANDPLPADALIVDETSMLDILLAKDLFSAIPKSCILVLVGDKDQLPSVGPGKVFADLVSLNHVCTYSLNRLFRRAEESNITTTAHSINSGVFPEIPTPDGATKSDAYFVPRKDAEEAAQLLEKLVADQIPRKFGFRPEDIAVLTPTNRGPLGTQRLNERLQNALNPSGSRDLEQEVEILGQAFRVGDRICQRVNNYQIDELGVFNGDIGTIYQIDKNSKTIIVELWDGRLIKYKGSDLGQISLAYAITVHRSQGSEIPCVVLALHDSQFALLDRQLLYTGVTRAKKLLVVVGSKRALQIAVRRANTNNRFSRLHEKVEALIAKG